MNKMIRVLMKKSDKEILQKLHSYKNDVDEEIVELANRVTTIPAINKELYFAILCHSKDQEATNINTIINKVYIALNNIILQSTNNKNINEEAKKYKKEIEEFKETLPKRYLYSEVENMLNHKKIAASFSIKTSRLINQLQSTQG